MKTIKKILCASLIALMTLFVVPVVMPLNQTVYTVEAAKVKINKTKYTMNKGEKYTLKISGTKKKVKWSTSNKKVATVSSKGKVTAKKKGKTTITAKVGGKKYKCKITVEDPSINKSKITLEVGNTYKLKVKNTDRSIKWSSSDKSIAKVDSKGKVTAKKAGKATITAKVGNKKLKCKVTVKNVDSKKFVKTSYTKLPDKELLIKYENVGNKKLDYVELDVRFYKDGSLLGSRMVNTICLGKGKTAYSVVNAPYDSNYKEMDYDSVKIIVSQANIYEYTPYEDLSKNLSITTNKSQDPYYSIVGEITNIGDKKIETIELGVIYYKANTIVGYSNIYEYNLDGGASKSIKASRPWGENDYLEFDSYKVVVNYVCNY